MQTTILQMFKRKERDEETQNVLQMIKTTPTQLRPRGRKRRLSQKKWQQVPQKPPQLCSINFLKSLALMADVLTELKNLSEILQNRKTTLPKAHHIMTTYVKHIESFNCDPGQHAVDASQAEEVMEFKGEELRVGRSPIIDSAQFIRAVADNMKERLFTTTANRAQASVAANRKEITALSIKWQSSTLTILDLEIMRQWDPLPYVNTWLGKGRRAAHSTSCMARRYTEEESYFSPLWKMWKSV
ncbi:hypothetical protein KUCAC02_016483 [Chaenocephalus aceratus]|nr:hypothetical protein KUCAC02_016483 [Chaenocephalus aceratus]